MHFIPFVIFRPLLKYHATLLVMLATNLLNSETFLGDECMFTFSTPKKVEFQCNNTMPRKKVHSKLPPLPGPVLRIIFQHLSQPERKKCRHVCTLWNRVLIYYDFLPQVADFFVDCRALLPKKSLFTSFFRPKQAMSTALQTLEDAYSHNRTCYILRSRPQAKLLAFEKMSTCISLNFISLLENIHTLELVAINPLKLDIVDLSQFISLITRLPQLTKLSLPIRLLSEVDPDKLSEPKSQCFSKLQSLQIQFPGVSSIIVDQNKRDLFIQMMAKVAGILASKSFQTLQHLHFFTSEPFISKNPSKKLKSPEVDEFFHEVDKISETLGTFLQQNMLGMVSSKLVLKTLTVNLQGFPVSAFDSSGILGLFAFIAMRGLRHLNLLVMASVLHTSLPTILHTMRLNYGVDIDLSLDFFLNGNESQVTNQYLLSLPEMHESLISISIRFLADYAHSNQIFFLEDFIPFNIRLDTEAGHAMFGKLTSLKIHLEQPTHKIFLTFGTFRTIWPNLKHIHIVMGRVEMYKSEGSIVYGFFKEQWKGQKDSSVSNVFYFRSILKFFPKLETLVFWADLQKCNDQVMLMGRASFDRYDVSRCVPNLQKLSLRGLGPKITNNCIPGFYFMKQLTHLELIGNHCINNSCKAQLLESSPSLREIKFKM